MLVALSKCLKQIIQIELEQIVIMFIILKFIILNWTNPDSRSCQQFILLSKIINFTRWNLMPSFFCLWNNNCFSCQLFHKIPKTNSSVRLSCILLLQQEMRKLAQTSVQNLTMNWAQQISNFISLISYPKKAFTNCEIMSMISLVG